MGSVGHCAPGLPERLHASHSDTASSHEDITRKRELLYGQLENLRETSLTLASMVQQAHNCRSIP